MEIKDMYLAVLLLVITGILLGVGLTVMGNTGDAVKTASTVADEQIVLTNGAGTTTNDEITISSVIFENSSDGKILISGNASTDPSFNITEAGGVVATVALENLNGTYNISYTYLGDTSASVSLDTSITGVGNFALWFAVIVVVMAAAIIIGIVIKSFRGA